MKLPYNEADAKKKQKFFSEHGVRCKRAVS